MKNRKTSIKTGIFMVLVVLFVQGCAQEKRYGVEIPATAVKVKLADIIKNTPRFSGKDVLLEGNYGGVCADRCAEEFNYMEGFSTIEVKTKGFKSPELKKGRPVRVFGKVKTTQESVYILAVAVETIKPAKAGQDRGRK